jgi:cytochrome c oxidase subunit 2
VDRRVTVRLATADVIHSFWIPSIAGKMDMIPGRLNEIGLQPTRTGTFRGACAEFCGTSHARMNFPVVVMTAAAFDAWLAAQARDASPPADPAAQRGQSLFFTHGCNTCHTVRGTVAAGVAGPDLTHVGSRLTLAAGQFPNDREHLARWIRETELLKPGVHMPAFITMPTGDLTALATFLKGLE